MNEEIFVKVLTGDQAGSYIPLVQDTEISIGNDYECDIYISTNFDSEILRAVFLINNGFIKFISSTSIIKNDQNHIIDLNSEYNLPFCFNFNEISIAILNKNELDTFSRVSEESALLKDILLDNTQNIEVPVLDIKTYDDENFTHSLKEKIINKISIFKNNINLSLFKKHLKVSISVFFIIAIVLIFSIVTSNFITSDKSKTEINNEVVLINDIKKVLLSLPNRYANLIFTQNEKKLIISGMVASEGDILKIHEYFKKYNSKIVWQLILSKDVINFINNTIKNFSTINELTVKYDEFNNKIYLIGLLSQYSKLNDIEIEINNKFTNIGDIDISQVYDLDQFNKDLQSMIELNKDRLIIEKKLNVGIINISGYLSNTELEILKKKVDDFNERYKSVVKVVLNIKDVFSALPFTIFSVHAGENGYIITNNGEKIFVGGEIGGFRIVNITNNKIIFNGKFPLELPLSQVEGNKVENNDNFRSEIIATEIANESTKIKEQREKIKMLNDYKKNINDPKVVNFINQQIKDLESDLALYDKEQDYYVKNNKGVQ